MFRSKWFEGQREHLLQGSAGEPLPHLFYDVTPEFTLDNRLVNVIVTTPQGSPHNYRVDLLSGQRYYAFSYCPKEQPNFSIAHIPRMLDQLGTPQKVLFFADPKKVQEMMGQNSFRARLVGGYVESSCPEGNCDGKKNWLSRLVFLAVDAEDKAYNGVTDLEQFLSMVNWPRTKALLESMEGKNFTGGTNGSVRIGRALKFKDSFEFFKKHSIFMSDKELAKVRKSCHALYDRLWTEVGLEREEDRPSRTIEELKAKVKLREELREKRVPVGFAERFQVFTRKYYNAISTCGKFVYAGNINKDPEKFWFLSYLNLFYMLHKEGYYFDCIHKSWHRNLIDTRGRPVYNLKKGVLDCRDGDIDLAMAYAPSFLEGLKGESSFEHYRFVDYDTHSFGTHAKLYSWVRLPTKKFECSDENEKIRRSLSVLPDDVRWKVRKVKDVETDLKIIY